MILQRVFRSFSYLLVFGVVLAPFGLPQSQAPAAHAQPELQAQIADTLPSINETEPNDSLAPDNQANRIGPGSFTPVWDQTITGQISTDDDLDWYQFTLPTPATNVVINLTNLPADYDLVLVNGPNGDADSDSADDGLEDVAAIGSKIKAISGSIEGVGGSVKAIGSKIKAIGSKIKAIGGSLTDASIQRDTTAEEIDTYLWQPGTFYIAVAGFNGAFSDQPYTLQISVDSSAWQSSQANVSPAPNVQLNLGSSLSTVNTLYLLSSSRMNTLYPNNEVPAGPQIKRAAQDLARVTNGYVLDLDDINRGSAATLVGSTETISDAYTSFDADPSNPSQANRVAKLIDHVITAATVRNPSGKAGGQLSPPMPNIRYIVLLGGDNVIPFYRVPDLTTVSNEGTYATYLRQIDPTGVIDPHSPLGGALHYRMILSDNIYGDDGAYNFPGSPLYLPDRAVGRLVETPDQIASYLEAYQSTRLVDATNARAAVTGYDFLTDQAQVVSQTLAVQGVTPTGLISDTWTAPELRQAWLNGEPKSVQQTTPALPSPYPLQSINAHFDHWQTIPATDTLGTLYAQDLFSLTGPEGGANYFFNQVCYSVGCHSGLNVDDASVSPSTNNASLYAADFPQTYLSQDGIWIGNTGYGYGTDQIAYSEQLSLLLTQAMGEQVVNARSQYVGQPIGAALAKAKQRYVRNASRLDAYDAKVLLQTTLYGLPFVPVKVKTPTAPPAEETRVDRVPAVQAPKVNNDGVLERVITFTNQFSQGKVPRTGNNYPILSGVQVEDSFVQSGLPAISPRLLNAVYAGLPTLPLFSYNLTALGPLGSGQRLQVKDVTFAGGNYTTIVNYKPQISQVVTQDLKLLRRGIEPTFLAGVNRWFPETFYRASNVGKGDNNRDQLLVTAAQFRANASGTRGAVRAYTKMVFKVIYIDPSAPNATAALTDTTPPQIDSVRVDPAGGASPAEATASLITVEAHDESSTGVVQVDGSYGDDQDNWTQFQFQKISDTGWVATIPVKPANARFIITARDAAGNVTTFDAKGEYTPQAQPKLVYLPVVRN